MCWKISKPYLAKEEYEKIEEHKVAILIGLSDLFNEWIELCEDLLEHASLFTEGQLLSRVTSTMGYFTSYKDFVLDFSRILIDAYSEHYLTEYIGKETKYLESIGHTIEDEMFYKSFNDEERGSLINMIEDIDLEFINHLNSLEENDIKHHLSKILEKNKDIIFTRTKFGFTLSTYPLSSLWIIYYDFLKQLKS